jgi:hypothetical protein
MVGLETPYLLVALYLPLSDRYGDTEDKKKVFMFIKKEAKKVLESEEMETFAKDNHKLMIEMVKAIVE